MSQFKSIFVIMLIVAAIVSGLIDVHFENKTPIDASAISAIVAMNAVVGFIQEYQSEKAMEAVIRGATANLFPIQGTLVRVSS